MYILENNKYCLEEGEKHVDKGEGEETEARYV